jgi:hypothetical protein
VFKATRPKRESSRGDLIQWQNASALGNGSNSYPLARSLKSDREKRTVDTDYDYPVLEGSQEVGYSAWKSHEKP